MNPFGVDRRVLVLALARMADAVGNSFLIVVLPLYIASGRIPIEGLVGTYAAFGFEFALTEWLLIGIVLSMFGFLNSFTQPFTGRLSDRTGKRKIYILFGLALLGAASGAYAFASSYWAVLLLRVLQGVGAAFTIPCTVALVNELATTSTRGNNFGVFNTFRLIGFGFGPIVAGVVVETWGFNAAFAVAVVGAFASFALVTLLVSDPERPETSAGDDLSIAVRGPGEKLLDPVFALGVGTVAMGICIAMFATLEGQINARLDQGTFLFGIQFGAVTIANVVFQIPIGRGSDAYGRRPFLLGGFALLVPATIAQGYVLDPWLMVLTRFVLGIAVAMVFAPSLAVAGDLAREGESGTTLSVLTMAFGLGIAIGPLASGFLERFGFAVPFLAGGVLAVLSLGLVATQVEETREGRAGTAPTAPQD
ncbi:MFS transporter [Salinirarus marinus]|uniref:MFS transporter n=1 Tax=Salinirarus marinus TaxID=3068310 RepID=UPI003C6C47F6